MTSVRLAWVTGLVAALVAMSAHSQHRESGDVYVGAAAGYHLAPDAEGEFQRVLDAVHGSGVAFASIDDGVFGWGVYGGFVVADGLALEAGYHGNTDMEITVHHVPGGTTASVDLSTSAFVAAVVGYFPMPHGSAAYPFLRAGIARWDSEASSRIGGVTVTVDDDGIDPLFGVGIDFPGFRNLSFRGEYMILLIDDDDGGSHHRFQAGVNFTF